MAGNRLQDLTGRSRIVINVLSGWFGYILFVISGFIMPRVIDEQLGQVSLGIWDFCWGLINYVALANLGVGASSNRYIARYRAEGNTEALRITVASATAVQMMIAALVLALTVILFYAIPALFSEELGEETATVRWVVLLVGLSFVVDVCTDASRGVITGSHRWDVINAIMATTRGVSLVLMVIALFSGGQLVTLAAIQLATSIISAASRVYAAHRICPGLQLQFLHVRPTRALEMLKFGVKTQLAGLPPLVLVQTANVLTLSTLGPATVAVIARPVALVHHIESFVNRFSFLMTPIAGSIQGVGDDGELRELLLTSTRYAVMFSLPAALVLGIYGDFILAIWMGDGYANELLVVILAGGTFLHISQGPALRVLAGLNMHGRVGLANLVLVALLFGSGATVLRNTVWTAENIALLIVVPLTLGNGVLIPLYACYRLGISPIHYVRQAFAGPLACNLILACCLLLSRSIASQHVWAGFITGSAVGGCIVLFLYWKFVVPAEHRQQVTSYVEARLDRRE